MALAPSSDGLAKLPRRRSRRQRSGKASGGQVGHPGVTLRQVAEPNQIVVHTPQVCPDCQADLATAPAVIRERRQVFELPPLGPVVIEHQVRQVWCPQCQRLTVSQFPPDVTQPVQYGAAVKSLAVYLQEYQHLPFARAQELLQDVLQFPLSEGTLANARATCARRLEAVAAAIKRAVTQAAIVNCDETGLRIQGRTQWLHVVSTPTLTRYAGHAQRGQTAMNAMGILPAFMGTAVHDALNAYLAYACRHSLCNAHLLRDLTVAGETTPQTWPAQIAELLLAIKAAVEQARTAGHTQLAPQQVADFRAHYQQLIEPALQANPPPPPRRPRYPNYRGRRREGPLRNLLLRLQNHAPAVLAFRHDFRVPFDNNLAERDLRMAKVRQKIAGNFRSWRGAEIFCIIRGYISTLRKHDQNVLAALTSVFAGSPQMPRLAPESLRNKGENGRHGFSVRI